MSEGSEVLEIRLRTMLADRVAEVHPSIDPAAIRDRAASRPRVRVRALPLAAAVVVIAIAITVGLLAGRHGTRTVRPGHAGVSSPAPVVSTPTPVRSFPRSGLSPTARSPRTTAVSPSATDVARTPTAGPTSTLP